VARECLEGREETLGPKHPNTLNASGNLGSVLMKSDDSSQQKHGRLMVEEALKRLKEEHKMPSTHPWVIKFENVLSPPDEAKL